LRAAKLRGVDVHVVLDDIDNETGPHGDNEDAIARSQLQSVTKPRTKGCGAQNTVWVLFALSKTHAVVIGGEVHRCGMPTIVIATSSERLVGRAMRPCFTCRGVNMTGELFGTDEGIRASPCTMQCWEGDGLKDDANRGLRRNMGRGSTLDRPPGARLRRQAPDPEYRQRPEERFNFPGFTGALER
jgi:hypothetical protein